jgi:phosphoglycolate phosphatase-like HAD superfamily hydrolase
MSKPQLYALDFDGVICDSALETSLTAWRAAREYLWPKMPEHIPAELIEQFKFVRPALETGYEAILIVRLLFEGLDPTTLLNEFTHRIEGLIHRDQLDTDRLKKRFGHTRDLWIENDLVDWLNMNPLFPGIQTKLAAINSAHCFIITTKQERFVQHILNANQISIPKEQIFGLERKLSKQQVLRQLQDEHPGHPIVFLEDRLPTLITVNNDQDLKGIQLLLANWGYNTAQDKQQASELKLKRIDLSDFSAL